MPQTSDTTILVVEDDPRIRKMVCVALGKAGYRVLQAGRGDDALSILRSHDGEIRLAVLDIMMPGMNGLDLANQMTIERPQTSILYMSGLDDSIAVETISRAEPRLMLQKPFTPKQLVARVKELLGNPGPISSNHE